VSDVADTENSPALAPESVILLMFRAASPELEMVSVWVPEEPERIFPEARDAATEIPGALPVPPRVTMPFPEPLESIVRVAALLPAEVGVNVTVTSELCPAGTLSVVAETENSAAFAPESVMLVMSSEMFPVLEMVSVWEVEAPTTALSRDSEAATEIFA
jgi:5,10-methenyltetrahydromethanopterin hydrogenase